MSEVETLLKDYSETLESARRAYHNVEYWGEPSWVDGKSIDELVDEKFAALAAALRASEAARLDSRDDAKYWEMEYDICARECNALKGSRQQDTEAWTEVAKLLNFGEMRDPWVLVGALQSQFKLNEARRQQAEQEYHELQAGAIFMNGEVLRLQVERDALAAEVTRLTVAHAQAVRDAYQAGWGDSCMPGANFTSTSRVKAFAAYLARLAQEQP